MSVLQEFRLPLARHAGVQIEVSTNGIEFLISLDNGQNDLVFNSALYFFFGMIVTSYLI